MGRPSAKRNADLEELGCTPGITYFTLHSETVETLLAYSNSQQDKLLGAFFRYFMTGQDQQVPKALRGAWIPLRISAKKTRENVLSQVNRGQGATSGATSGTPAGATPGATSGATPGSPSGATPGTRNVSYPQHSTSTLNTQHSSSASAPSTEPHPQPSQHEPLNIKHATSQQVRGAEASGNGSTPSEPSYLERLLMSSAGTESGNSEGGEGEREPEKVGRREFDAMRLAETLDGMSDLKTKPGTLPDLAAAIEDVREGWPKARKYPEQVWVDAYRRHLDSNPRNASNRRVKYARTWVQNLSNQDGPEASDLINAWIGYRKSHES